MGFLIFVLLVCALCQPDPPPEPYVPFKQWVGQFLGNCAKFLFVCGCLVAVMALTAAFFEIRQQLIKPAEVAKVEQCTSEPKPGFCKPAKVTEELCAVRVAPLGDCARTASR